MKQHAPILASVLKKISTSQLLIKNIDSAQTLKSLIRLYNLKSEVESISCINGLQFDWMLNFIVDIVIFFDKIVRGMFWNIPSVRGKNLFRYFTASVMLHVTFRRGIRSIHFLSIRNTSLLWKWTFDAFEITSLLTHFNSWSNTSKNFAFWYHIISKYFLLARKMSVFWKWTFFLTHLNYQLMAIDGDQCSNASKNFASWHHIKSIYFFRLEKWVHFENEIFFGQLKLSSHG